MSGRIKVLQVVNSLAAAGAERTTVELARALPKDEFDVHVLVVRDGPLRAVLEAEGLPVTVVGGEFDLRAPLVVLRMVRQMRALGPDIVHTHMIGSDIVGGLAAHLARVPAILTTQHDTYRRPLIYDLFRRFSSRRLDAVVAISPSVVDYCLRDLHMPVERVHVIENAVDTGRFPARAAPASGSVTFGAIGTLIPVKGHAIVLEALARVREVVPGARLLVAGEGRDRDVLVQRARSLGVTDAVEFRGLVSDIPAFLAEVDVLVHPSVQEAFGLAVVEGMAANRPVIASDLPAIRRVLDNGAAGVLVSPGDAGALAVAMIDLATHPDRARELAEAGGRRVREHYCHERLAGEYAALYRDLLARTVARG